MADGTPPRHAQRISSNGLSGLRWGDDRAEAVFLHGALLSARAWDRVLSVSGYPAIALDLPGHGESAWWPDGEYTSERVSALIATWWTNAEEIASRSVLVGHSRGALVAVHLAARIPSAIRHLVLVDADPTRPRPRRSGRPVMRSTGAFDDLVDDAMRMRPDLLRDRVADGVRRGAVDNLDGTWSWRWDPRIREVPIGGGLLDGDATALGAVRCPVTIVRGRDSPAVGEEALVRIEQTLGRGVDVHTVPGGHNPHAEAPDELADIIRDIVRAESG